MLGLRHATRRHGSVAARILRDVHTVDRIQHGAAGRSARSVVLDWRGALVVGGTLVNVWLGKPAPSVSDSGESDV